MDFEYKIYLARAQNELNLSVMVQKISDDKKMQIEIFGMKEDTSYLNTKKTKEEDSHTREYRKQTKSQQKKV